MAQQEYGAAQPIVEFFSKSKKKAPPPPPAVDTKWHEEMVRKANRSFVDADKRTTEEANKRAVSPTDAAKLKAKAGASKRAVSQKLRSKRS